MLDFISKIIGLVRKLIRFLTYDLWRYTSDSVSARKMNLFNILKAFILAVRNVNSYELNTRAAALTYKTLLSIVPLLAILFAIASGFGLQDVLISELTKFFEGQAEMIEKARVLIVDSLQYARSGVFLGIGIVLLLYTVIDLLGSIEDNCNTIWNIKTGRSYYRQFTDYLALIIITPVFIICNAGLTVFISQASNIQYIGYVVSPFMKLIPFAITILLFTFIYVYVPNTKVKISSGLIAGAFTGIAFQIFQVLYINGQIWISKYNALYGSFAALPLLMLWLQLSWFILLFGVQLSFAYQNVNKFSFEQETNSISRRYKDFIELAIVSLIVKRFEKGEKPYTADEISSSYKIPTKLTSEIIYHLQEIGIIIETPSDTQLVPAYVPAMDINQLSVGLLLDRSLKYGSEDFVIDIHQKFNKEWKQIQKMGEKVVESERNILIKDL